MRGGVGSPPLEEERAEPAPNTAPDSRVGQSEGSGGWGSACDRAFVAGKRAGAWGDDHADGASLTFTRRRGCC